MHPQERYSPIDAGGTPGCADRRRGPFRASAPPATCRSSCPGKTYAILEARDAIGGTWDLFRYPGIRSDSDMHTLGYRFRPWTEAKSIADGPSILQLRPRHRPRATASSATSASTTGCVGADWSSADARWTVEAERTDTGETVQLTCGFLFMLHRLLPLRRGLHAASSPGIDRFAGRGRPPAALARGPRLRRQAGRRDRQRRHRGHARAGDGRARRARDDAPALADLRGLAAGRGPARQPPAPPCCPTQAAYAARPLEERAAADGLLPAQPARGRS